MSKELLNKQVSRRDLLIGIGTAVAGVKVFDSGILQRGLIVAGATLKPKEATADGEISGQGYRITGVPISGVTNVDFARPERGFKNSIGAGTEMAIADDGGLLVGPDFESSHSGNPYGDNSRGWAAMWESDGHIYPISPVTQDVPHLTDRQGHPLPFVQQAPEGGYMFAQGRKMTWQVGDERFEFNGDEHTNVFFIVRGRFGDSQQDTDRNTDLVMTDYIPSHTDVEMYQAGLHANTAFISQGQFLQDVKTSHSSGTNGGDGGNSRLLVAIYDINTKALTVDEHIQGRLQDPKLVPFNELVQNWSK